VIVSVASTLKADSATPADQVRTSVARQPTHLSRRLWWYWNIRPLQL